MGHRYLIIAFICFWIQHGSASDDYYYGSGDYYYYGSGDYYYYYGPTSAPPTEYPCIGPDESHKLCDRYNYGGSEYKICTPVLL